MNLDDLLIPAKMTRSFLSIYEAKSLLDERTGVSCRLIPEKDLVRLFLAMGAVPSDMKSDSSFSLSKNELPQGLGVKVSENQGSDIGLPQGIVQVMQNEEANIIKAIMIYKNLPLKVVAERYGGKSAAANIANFSARTNHELIRTRTSTLQRIADALEVPVSWIGGFLDTLE